jgi:hypothetical protein
LTLCSVPEPEHTLHRLVHDVDAKIAVVLLAVKQGLIEFIRFGNNSPPQGYFARLAKWSEKVLGDSKSNKRKEADTVDEESDGQDRRKKQKPNDGNHNSTREEGEVSPLKSRQGPIARKDTRSNKSKSSGRNTTYLDLTGLVPSESLHMQQIAR